MPVWKPHRSVLVLALSLCSLPLLGCAKSAGTIQPAPAKAALTWDDQRSHVYALELSTVAQLSGSPTASPLVLRSDVELSFRGEAAARQALVKLVRPQLMDESGKAAESSTAFETELGKPFAVELRHGIVQAYFEPAAQTQVTGFRRHIVAALQWQEHAPRNSWRSQEWDATGLSNVQYVAVANAARTWDWQKLGYERLVVTEKRAAQALDTSKVAPKVDSATGRLMTDASGIVSVERREKLSVPLSSTTSLTTDITLKLKRTGFGSVAGPDEWTQLQQTWQRAEVGSPAAAQDTALTDQARIGSHTFPELVAKLTELAGEHDSAHPPAAEAGPLFHALVGIFRQQPQQIDAAAKLIRNGSPVRDTLLDALAMASSAQALDSLGTLALDHSAPEALRVRAAGSLIRAHEPSSGALELAVKMLDEPQLRESGLYGIGSFVRQLRDHGNTALADAGTRVLAQQLGLATSPSDLTTVLLAISNSGSAELFEPAVSYQKHTNATVRHAAIEAIRLMPQADVELRLREVLERKDRGDVLAALHALGRRPKATRESVDRVEAIAKQDPSPELRREAVLVLGLWSQLYPALLPVLAELREHDSDQRVRDVAKPIAAQ